MKKRYKFLLSLILLVMLSIFCADSTHASDEENPPSNTKVETSEGEGQGDGKDKIIITEEPETPKNKQAHPIKDSLPSDKKLKQEAKTRETDKKKEELSPKEDKTKPSDKEASKDNLKKGGEKGSLTDRNIPQETTDKKKEKSEQEKNPTNSKDENVPITTSSSTGLDSQTSENSNSEYLSEDDYKKDYLENQKNDTLLLEIGPNEDRSKLNPIKIEKKKKNNYEAPNGNRIYIHLLGVFILSLTALILLKVLRTKKA
ncbi:hypothetical protein [Anaerococcus tetradius]|uniref:hypothetical protein n=1 Tax=Anaerococcus tetradius TaxID=33036 RepID=UPI0023F3D2DA|nr:hypothetical protein [Anaerococcus tetradius]